MVPFARLTINGQVESKRKKGETSPTNLDNDFDFVDTVLMGLDSMDGAVLKGPDDVTNPFDFNLWRSVPVETLGIKKLETVLYKMSTNVELRIGNKLPS